MKRQSDDTGRQVVIRVAIRMHCEAADVPCRRPRHRESCTVSNEGVFACPLAFVLVSI